MTFSVTELTGATLAERFVGKRVAYVGWLSFDERCLSAVRVLRKNGHRSFRFLTFGESTAKSALNRGKLEALLPKRQVLLSPVSRSDQISGFRTLVETLRSAASRHDILVVDVSAFPREYVCMLAYVLTSGSVRKLVYLIYNRAIEYSVSEPLERKWLSIGSGPISPVINFSGKLTPGKPSLIVALLGFPDDRVVSMVDALGPNVLILGKPRTSDQRRSWMVDKINDASLVFSWRISDVKEVEFDCDSVEGTIDCINSAIREYVDTHNITIAPNNNKISTFGSGLVGCANRSIQIAFSPAIVYNSSNYSVPSDEYQMIEDTF